MRLYNAQSCTPMGSSSIYVTPKGSPPRKDLPQSPTAFARKWKLQRRKNPPVDTQVETNFVTGASSPHRASKITSAFFDPFEIDDNMANPFTKNGDSQSSATSATEKLTPVVSAESHDLFATNAEADEFATFPVPFTTRHIDFQNPAEGDLFNDASTWMTSSTLSTKFTNHEMNMATMSRWGPTDDVKRAFAFSGEVGNGTTRPDEVFVKTSSQPSFDTETFPQIDSAASKRESQWWHQANTAQEAFDPFAIGSTTQKPTASDKHRATNGFDKENQPVQYLPRTYVSAKANLRSLRKSAHRPQSPASPLKEDLKTSMPRNFQQKDSSGRSLVHTSQQSKFASFPRLDPVREADTGEGERRLKGRPTSTLSSRAPFASLQKVADHFVQPKNTKTVVKNSHRPSRISNEEECKPDETRSRPTFVVSDMPPSCNLLGSKGVTKGTTKGKKVPASLDANPPPSSHLKGFLSSAELTSGKARLRKKSADVLTQDSKAVAAGAPGSFLAERVEAARPAAVFHSRVDVASPLSPARRVKPKDSKNSSSPVKVKTKDLVQGNALQDMLSKRFGKNTSAQSNGAIIPALPQEKPKSDSSVAEDRTSEVTEKGSNDKLALKDDPKYQKYFKMLKMGLPMGAVKNAMERDGLDASLMDGDHSAPAGQQQEEGVPLKDDPKYAKYVKMLKMGLPMGAVKNAMERDGLDPCVIDGDLSAPAGGETAKQGPRKAPPKDKYRRTRVHWETHNTVRSNTVWAMVNRDPDVAELTVDEEEFATLFEAESKPAAQQSSAPTGATEKGAVKVIDKKRANNGGITLARIKLTYQEIATAVDSYDESALTQEQIRGILGYLPTSEEKTALRSYLDAGGSNDVDSLCECEKFMVAIMTVKHAKRKLNALLYIQKFASSLEELRRDARLVQKACDEIMSSSRFRKILGIVLNLGNRLNTAGPVMKEPAEAVTLDSLLKLNQPKAFDKKTTFLQYVASVVRRNNASLCHFKDDLAAVFIAEKILWETTLGELKRMENELESVRRLALYHALERDHTQTSTRGSVNGDSVAAMSIPSKLSVEEEIALLGKTSIGEFTLEACASMAAVVDEVNNARTSYNALLLYFGEEDNTSAQPNDVFRTISVFSKVKSPMEVFPSRLISSWTESFDGMLIAATESPLTDPLDVAWARSFSRAWYNASLRTLSSSFSIRFSSASVLSQRIFSAIKTAARSSLKWQSEALFRLTTRAMYCRKVVFLSKAFG